MLVFPKYRAQTGSGILSFPSIRSLISIGKKRKKLKARRKNGMCQ